MNERFTKKIAEIEKIYIKLVDHFKQYVIFKPEADFKQSLETLNTLVKREENHQYLRFCKNVMKCINTF